MDVAPATTSSVDSGAASTARIEQPQDQPSGTKKPISFSTTAKVVLAANRFPFQGATSGATAEMHNPE